MPTTTQDLTLVTAATGKTGRRVAERLTAAGHAVRIGSRSATPALDWEDPATWAPALAGCSAAYVAFAPDLAVPGAPEAVGAFTAAAVEQGVRRLVLLSGRGEPEAQRAEDVVRATAPGRAEVTVVRSSFFMQNFTESFVADGVAAGEVVLPVGDGVREAFVDADDIADVAAAALTGDGHGGRTYEVTGPELLTFAEATAAMGRASGRDVRCVEVPLDAWTAALAQGGLAADVVALLGYLFGEVLDGRNASLAPGVQEALGRPPRDFAAFARDAARAAAVA